MSMWPCFWTTKIIAPPGVEFLHQLSGGQVGKEIRDKIMDTPFQEDFEEELKALEE